MREPQCLRDYAEQLDKVLSKGRDYTTFNDDLLNARILVGTALAHAKHKVLLVSHKLAPRLYGHAWFTKAARGFVGRQGRLDILVESDINEDHPVKALERDHPDLVTITRVPDQVVRTYDFNFMLVDESGYRFEQDRTKCRAWVVFNWDDDKHRTAIATLKTRFASIKEMAVA